MSVYHTENVPVILYHPETCLLELFGQGPANVQAVTGKEIL